MGKLCLRSGRNVKGSTVRLQPDCGALERQSLLLVETNRKTHYSCHSQSRKLSACDPVI